MIEPKVHAAFEPVTGTWQYIVADPTSKKAVVIDSVLDFDAATNSLSTRSADELLALIGKEGYAITHILETHAHADHLTASRYLQKMLTENGQARPLVCIGRRIHDVQAFFGPRYGVDKDELEEAFDGTFDDDEKFNIGNLEAKILHLPGHTPDHIGYVIGENVFTGDSIFNHDVGSARCDFPGGSATTLYKSIQQLLFLPSHYRLYTGHDYPPETRAAGEDGKKAVPYTTVEKQGLENKHVNRETREEDFVSWRSNRDSQLAEPKLMHQALQVNIRGGRLPKKSPDGLRLLHIPLKVPQVLDS